MTEDFFSRVHHKTGGMIAIIREGIAIVLSREVGPLNKKQEYFLDIAEKTVDKLTRFVNNEFLFQKLMSGKIDPDMRDNDINEVVEDVREGKIGPILSKDGINFMTEFDNTLPRAVFDRQLIGQVMIYLINNAFQAVENGSVTVKTGRSNGNIYVSVRDTGAGIRKEEISVLFDHFKQLEKDEQMESDTGFGLPISKKIIEMHNGRIWAESEPGNGSTFTFELPIRE